MDFYSFIYFILLKQISYTNNFVSEASCRIENKYCDTSQIEQKQRILQSNYFKQGIISKSPAKDPYTGNISLQPTMITIKLGHLNFGH